MYELKESLDDKISLNLIPKTGVTDPAYIKDDNKKNNNILMFCFINKCFIYLMGRQAPH